MSVSSVRKGHFVMALLSILAVSLLSSLAFSQSDENPKWDLFAGYQWDHPGGRVPTPFGDYNNPIGYQVPDMAKGFGSSLTYNFDQHFGGEVDLGHNWGSSNYMTTASLGPRFIWRTEDSAFFLHTLVSFNRLAVSGLNTSNGIGAILGGGMDLPIHRHLAWRVFEADWVWSAHNYSTYAAPSDTNNLRRPEFEGVRLRTGLVFSWGGGPEVPPAATCSVQPAEVMVGEPITATVTASNFNPKHTVTYTWSGNGGQVTGKDTAAQIDTTNAAPGSYVITVHVTDSKMSKNNEASCTANYVIKPLPPKNPPTMSISAEPSSVPAGGTVNLTANCTSPDSVPVSVATWTATSGTVSGSGASASLNTAGATPGPITVGATCTDSRGLTGQGSTQVMIENPPPPPPNPEIVRLEGRLTLHSIYFPTAMPPLGRDPLRGLLASQKQTLTALATDFKSYLELKPEAHLVLGGHADHRGSVEYNQHLTERRVNATKLFLVQQGVPEDHIDTKAFGKEDNLTTEQVTDAINNNPELSTEERARVLKNIVIIRMASNRRVDVTLTTTGQTSVRQFPFNSTDSLTLIGGREADMMKKKKPAPKKGTGKPGARKQQ